MAQWDLENSANPGYDDQLFLTYHGNEDVWPWWTNDFHITDIEAPWGAQQDWFLNTAPHSNGFRTFMSCGNIGDEGESGETYNTLLIVPKHTGFDDGAVDNNEVNEKQVLDITFSFDLAATYPIGDDCTIEIKWDNDIFNPSWIEFQDD